jgi:hypothetical protein
MIPNRHGGGRADVIQMECDVIDRIVCWDEVGEGDLVLHDDHMCELTAWGPSSDIPDKYVTVRFDCDSKKDQYFPRHWPVAVRRYVEHPAGE